MSDQVMTIVMSAAAGIGAIIAFIAAIVTSYEIERRSDGKIMRYGVPRYTNMVRTAIAGPSVAKDEETRELVKKLRMRLLFVFALMALLALTTLQY
ncbi:hypothetical protein ACKTEK_00645 [Tepidamorphus sp. 3E244]|uniref:hypothetical protein n=1 Tax=Tepidamorphus sp. 3E244 TaxID=3385498 RepID=UPI0038FC3038